MLNEFVGIEVGLEQPDDFLLVKESLTRMGIASLKNKTLYQSVHILHKRGRYFLCHFKDLFELDGKNSTLDDDDKKRRNLIAKLLSDWGLLTILNKEDIADCASLSSIKILPFKEKDNWKLVAKYTIGNK